MPGPETATDSEAPFPPRYWWLKRISVISIGVVLIYVMLMVWWRYEGNRRLNAEIRKVQAIDWPVASAAFTTESIPDELNAAVSLQRAAQSLKLTRADEEFLRGLSPRNAGAQTRRALLEALILHCRDALAFSRLSRFQPFANWESQRRSNLGFHNQTRLSLVLLHAAELKHMDGHDAETVEFLRDALHQAEMLEADGWLIGHLSSSIVMNNVSRSIRTISPQLTLLSDSQATTKPAGRASQAQIESMIRQLLDDQTFREGLARGFYTERKLMVQYLQQNGSIDESTEFVEGWTVGDADRFGTVRVLHHFGKIIPSLKLPDYPTALSQFPPSREADRRTGLTRRVRADLALWPDLTGRVVEHFNTLARRRASAIHFALRLYQLDHDGNLPVSLGELVPRYLPFLPVDPFAADGRALGYQPTPAPLVFSIGNTGANGGKNPTFTYPYGQPTTAPAVTEER